MVIKSLFIPSIQLKICNINFSKFIYFFLIFRIILILHYISSTLSKFTLYYFIAPIISLEEY